MNNTLRLAVTCLPVTLFAATAGAETLTHVSVSILNSGGTGGTGASTSDMVFAQYSSDGWGWAGGAGGVQGTGATYSTGSGVAANEALKFNVGATVDTLDTTYGAGNWTIANPVLSFASASMKQNNSRFGVGSGTYDVYWVANDGWAQSAGTPTDKALNPVYASTAAGLLTWSGGQTLLSSQTFTSINPPTTSASYQTVTVNLPTASPFVSDITSASATAGSNPAASLYLMGTSASLGMIIYSGGQGQALPMLSFDVVSVPEPTAAGIAAVASGLLVRRRPGRIG